MFVVVVVGGLGSSRAPYRFPPIGIVQTFAVSLDYAIHGVSLSRVAPVLPYLIMVAILIARPRGLMGTRES